MIYSSQHAEAQKDETIEFLKRKCELLEDENEVLRQELSKFRAVNENPAYMAYFGFTRGESVILAELVHNEFANVTVLGLKLYQYRSTVDHPLQVVRIFIGQMRKKLMKWGITIVTVPQFGYQISVEDKRKLEELLTSFRE